MSVNKIISDALDIASFSEQQAEILPSEEQTDFEFARKNIRSILERGSAALDKMIDIADLSQHPRSYEVVATLIKTVSEANKDLLQIAKTKKEIQKEDAPQNQKVTNNLFVGSTTELQKMLKNLNDKK